MYKHVRTAQTDHKKYDEGKRTEETKGGGQRRQREEDRGDEGRRTEETKGNVSCVPVNSSDKLGLWGTST
jgi:hypothetical protein